MIYAMRISINWRSDEPHPSEGSGNPFGIRQFRRHAPAWEDAMEYRTSDQIERVGDIIHPQQLSRNERLERWAEALDRLKGTQLRTLRETEYQPRVARLDMREDNSPLSVAFADPVLRSAGIQSDTYGEAQRFFDLTDWDLHKILCYCHFGESVAADRVARNVRGLISNGRSTLLNGCVLGAGTLAGLGLLALIG